MFSLKRGLGVFALLGALSAHASVTVVTTPAGLGATDSVDWSQLGSDGTIFGPNFSATSVGARSITGVLAGGNACAATVDGSICSWSPGAGFLSGDAVIWAENTDFAGSGNLSFSFAAVLGAGLYLQAASSGAFTASIAAYNGAILLNSFTVPSPSGSGIFIGVIDSVADITKIQIGLASCAAGCDVNDFAVNSLQLKPASAVPELPSSALILLGLLALPWAHRRANQITKSK